MWTRTPSGFFLGLVLALSIGLNATLLGPWPRPVGLVIAFVGGFLLLAGYQTWAFCTPQLPRFLRWSMPALFITVGLNAWALMRASS